MNVAMELDTITDLDWSPVIPCEGEYHPRGLTGHDPDAPAAFILISPCCGKSVMQCAGRVAYMRVNGFVTCSPCGIEHAINDYWILPIQDKTP